MGTDSSGSPSPPAAALPPAGGAQPPLWGRAGPPRGLKGHVGTDPSGGGAGTLCPHLRVSVGPGLVGGSLSRPPS